ncbi:tRNA pseudouridine synthase A, partial [Hyalangium sp.]|uniref:tRNA pseudouridine synthase A n=1 Tax=Hyalangium sp. TaxID=2028555 RepID=UPI002D5F147D
MPRMKLVLEYDGTRYVGWQVQTNGRALQAELQEALGKLLGAPVEVEAAGRTDSGVHATGQVVCFNTERTLPLKAYWRGLNGMLPEDIAVVHAEEVPPEFDPRRWSRGKRYRYRVSNRRSRSPLRRHTHWEVYAPL